MDLVAAQDYIDDLLDGLSDMSVYAPTSPCDESVASGGDDINVLCNLFQMLGVGFEEARLHSKLIALWPKGSSAGDVYERMDGTTMTMRKVRG